MSLNIIPADLLNNLYFQTYSPIRGSGWGVGGLDGGGGGGLKISKREIFEHAEKCSET